MARLTQREVTIWSSYTNIIATCDFNGLLQKVLDPEYHFFKGLQLFRPLPSNSTECGEIQTISKELALHERQVKALQDMVKGRNRASGVDMASQVKALYFAERLAILQCLSSVFEEFYKGTYHDMDTLELAIRTLRSEGVVAGLLTDLIDQLNAYAQGNLKTMTPLTAGEKEIECLVELLMFNYRDSPCPSANTLQLLKAIRSCLTPVDFSTFHVKLALLPMLAFGFWQALDDPTDNHGHSRHSTLQPEFTELDKFFSMLEPTNRKPIESVMQLSWQLFRKFHSTVASPSSPDAMFIGGVYVGHMETNSVSDWIRSLIQYVSRSTLGRECLLMMMSALTLYRVTFQDRFQCFKFFKVLSEVLQGDFYLCERFFDCKTHWRLNNIFQQSKEWFAVSVYPLMTLLSSFCFPEFVPRISALLTTGRFGIISLHSEIDLCCIQLDSSTGRAVSLTNIHPTIGQQIMVLEQSNGEIWHPNNIPEWLIPTIPGSILVKWDLYEFKTLFQCMVYQISRMSSAESSPSTKEQALLDAMSLVDFSSAYLRSIRDCGMDNNLLSAETLIEPIAEWMELFLEKDYDISSILHLLKGVCETSPNRVIEAMNKTSFFQSNQDSLLNLQKVLSLTETESKLYQMMHVAHALIDLLAEFAKHGFHFEHSQNWFELLCHTLIPKMRTLDHDVYKEPLVKLYSVIMDFFHFLITEEVNKLEMKGTLLEEISIRYGLENCILGALKLIPHQMEGLSSMNALQTQLMTRMCLCLSALLEKGDLENQSLMKIVNFLRYKSYWQDEASSAILNLYCAKAFRTSELQSLNVQCSVASIKFLSVYLTQLYKSGTAQAAPPMGFNEEPLLSALPLKLSEVHPDFRKALVLTSVYNGKEVHEALIIASVDLLVTVSYLDSSLFSFLVYPSKMDPGVTPRDNSLLDVLWMGLSSCEELWNKKSSLLWTLLRGIRAVQLNKVAEEVAWQALTGQDTFLANLLKIISFKYKERDLEEHIIAKQAVHATCLQIIENEILQRPVNQVLANQIPLSVQDHWKAWLRILEGAFSPPDINLDAERLLYALANCASFEIYYSMRFGGPLFGLEKAFPWMKEIHEIVEITLRDAGVKIEDVIEYIQDVIVNVTTGLQLQNVLFYPRQCLDFLANDVRPGRTLLDYLVGYDVHWNDEIQPLIKHKDQQVNDILPRCVSLQCNTYKMLKELIKNHFQIYLSFLSLRSHLITSWRKITKMSFSSGLLGHVFVKQSLQEILPILMENGEKWLTVCSIHVSGLQNHDHNIFICKNINRLCASWDLSLAAQVLGALLDCTELMPYTKSQSIEPSALIPASPASPAPSNIPRMIRQESHIDYSLIEVEQICQILSQWFRILEAIDALSGEEQLKQKSSIQTGTMHATSLIRLLIPKISDRMNSEPIDQDLKAILVGMLSAIDPRKLGYEAANNALFALVKSCEFVDIWDESLLKLFYLHAPIGALLDYAMNHISHVMRSAEESEDFQNWMTNFFAGLSLMWNQSQLQGAFLDKHIIQKLSQYAQLLFNPNGAMQLEGAYRKNGQKNAVFDHWCILQSLTGHMISKVLVLNQTSLSEDSVDFSILQLFEQISALVNSSFTNLFTADFGTNHHPLTLGKLEQMEGALTFLILSHEISASGVQRIHQYNLRRQEILLFLKVSDVILHGRVASNFLSVPVSSQEKSFDQQILQFNIRTGWFRFCKTGFQTSGIPGEQDFPLTKFSWMISKKLYICINGALRYLKLSSPPFCKEEVENHSSSLLVPSKDLLLRLQSDALEVCQHLMDATGSNLDENLKSGFRELAQTLISIVKLTAEFLEDWGYSRRKKHLERFNNQVDVMHQLSVVLQ